MPSRRRISVLLFLVSIFCVGLRAQDKEPNFPTDDEIQLLMTQTERAIGQYKLLLAQEEQMLGKKSAEAVLRIVRS
jgi:hypothetical protein